MAAQKQDDIYAECRHILRTKPDMTVDRLTAEAIGKDFRVLPSFERQLFEKKYIKHNSMSTNELLKCRWDLYKKNIANKVFSPFQFPCIRDLHFHTGTIRYLPDETIVNRSDHRMKLRPGPGVDFRGQIPIPLELQMRKSVAVKKGDGRKKNKKQKDAETSNEKGSVEEKTT